MLNAGRQPERRQQEQDEFRIDIYEEGNNHFGVDRSGTPFDIEEAEERWMKEWEEGFPKGTVFEREDFPDNAERSWSRAFVAVLDGKVLDRVEVCQIDESPKEDET